MTFLEKKKIFLQVRQPRRQQFDGGGHQRQRHHYGVRPQDAVLSSPPMTTANVTSSFGGTPLGVDPHGGHSAPSAAAASLSRRPSHRHRRGSSSWSVRSWDSHAHYQDFPPDEDEDEDEDDVDVVDGVAGVPGGLFPSKSSIVCYCDMSTFKTPRTLLRVLLVVRKF